MVSPSCKNTIHHGRRAQREEAYGNAERMRESREVAGRKVGREESRTASPDPAADLDWTLGSDTPLPDTLLTSWRMFSLPRSAAPPPTILDKYLTAETCA